MEDDEDALLAAAIAASLSPLPPSSDTSVEPTSQPPQQQSETSVDSVNPTSDSPVQQSEAPAETTSAPTRELIDEATSTPLETSVEELASAITPPQEPKKKEVNVFDRTAQFEKLLVAEAHDRTLGPAPQAPDGPVGCSLIEFLQYFLSRRDIAIKGDMASCVQLRTARQHNVHSCGYFALYNAKEALDVMQARTERAALYAAGGLANEDRAFEFVKKVQAELKQYDFVQSRLQSKESKELFENFELTRADASAALRNHPILRSHKDSITLVCDPSKLEPEVNSEANPSIRDIDTIFYELRTGSKPFHVFIFGAHDHFYTLVVWSYPVCNVRENEVANQGESVTKVGPDRLLQRNFELILFDSENNLNLTFDVEKAPPEKKGLKNRVDAANEFVNLVAACTRQGNSMATMRVKAATDMFVAHTKQIIDDLGVVDEVMVGKLLDDRSFVQESFSRLETILHLFAAFDRLVPIDKNVCDERLEKIVRSMITVKATNPPDQLGRSESTSQPLPLMRTISGTLWTARNDELLRQLAEKLGMDDLPPCPDWGPRIPPPSDDLAKTLVKGSYEVLDMDEARELLMAIAYQEQRIEALPADVNTALNLVHEELNRRPMCRNGHPLAKSKREHMWCNYCNKGFIPDGVDPYAFLALPWDIQQEERRRTRCLIMSDYLCKECKDDQAFYCCEKCFLGRGRGTVVQACIRTNRGEVEAPESEWRCYQNYDAFPGDNAAKHMLGDLAGTKIDSQSTEAVLAAAVESAKSKCTDSSFGGFAIHNGVIYFRRQGCLDCHTNLHPADGVIFYVAPRSESVKSKQQGELVDEFEETKAKQREAEHREKISTVQAAVMSFGYDLLTDVQAVFCLEQVSYDVERAGEFAVGRILDGLDLNPPPSWTSSCVCHSCRPKR